SNPYLTHDDFDKLRELEDRVRRLRSKAACTDFHAAAVALLDAETARYNACATNLDHLTKRCEDAQQRYASAVTAAADCLALELFICRQSDAAHPLKECFERFVPAGRLGRLAPGADQVAAVEAFRVDESRLITCINVLAAALDALTQTTRDLVAACRTGIEPQRDQVVENRVVVPKGDRGTESKTDLGTLGAAGKQYAFLDFTKPPALRTLDCDSALGLYLNVAEDVAAGAIQLNTAPAIKATYNAFMAAVTNVDQSLSKAMMLEAQLRERLAAATTFHRDVAALLRPATVTAAANTLKAALTAGKAMLSRAVQLATIGDSRLAQRLAEKAMDSSRALLSKAAVEKPLREQASRLTAVERSFNAVEAEASRQREGWRSLVGEIIPLINSHEDLRARLDEFFGLHRSTRWGPGSELGRGVMSFVRQCREWCELAHYTPALPSWAVLHDTLERTRPRDVAAPSAFANALCAMAHTHDGLSDDESTLIARIARDRGLGLRQEQVDAMVRHWRSLPRDQSTLRAIAQAITDVQNISDRGMLENLSQDLCRVAQIDEDLANDEITVYHGFVTTMSRMLYPTFAS
ncbi:MAG: hypothetical protein ACKOEM_09975, partial [Planctomycetia bacterium]